MKKSIKIIYMIKNTRHHPKHVVCVNSFNTTTYVYEVGIIVFYYYSYSRKEETSAETLGVYHKLTEAVSGRS